MFTKFSKETFSHLLQQLKPPLATKYFLSLSIYPCLSITTNYKLPTTNYYRQLVTPHTTSSVASSLTRKPAFEPDREKIVKCFLMFKIALTQRPHTLGIQKQIHCVPLALRRNTNIQDVKSIKITKYINEKIYQTNTLNEAYLKSAQSCICTCAWPAKIIVSKRLLQTHTHKNTHLLQNDTYIDTQIHCN